MQCSLAALVAVPAHPEEAVFEVEEEKEVRAQVAQGIAWPPPRAEAEDFGVGRSLKRGRFSRHPDGWSRQSGKVHLEILSYAIRYSIA